MLPRCCKCVKVQLREMPSYSPFHLLIQMTREEEILSVGVEGMKFEEIVKLTRKRMSRCVYRHPASNSRVADIHARQTKKSLI